MARRMGQYGRGPESPGKSEINLGVGKRTHIDRLRTAVHVPKTKQANLDVDEKGVRNREHTYASGRGRRVSGASDDDPMKSKPRTLLGHSSPVLSDPL